MFFNFSFDFAVQSNRIGVKQVYLLRLNCQFLTKFWQPNLSIFVNPFLSTINHKVMIVRCPKHNVLKLKFKNTSKVLFFLSLIPFYKDIDFKKVMIKLYRTFPPSKSKDIYIFFWIRKYILKKKWLFRLPGIEI